MNARDLAIRTMWGEAANEPEQGQAAVAHVIQNRMKAGRYGGTDVQGVVSKPYAFEPWQSRRGDLLNLSPNDPKYQALGQVWDRVASGETPDPTKGSTHFYAPIAQQMLARQDGRKLVPNWAQGREPNATIGGHQFFSPDDGAAAGSKSMNPMEMAYSGVQPQRPQVSVDPRGTEVVDPEMLIPGYGNRGAQDPFGGLGGALTNAGASLMSIYNPAGGAVLAAQAKAGAVDKDKFTSHYDPKSRSIMRTHNATGQTDVTRVGGNVTEPIPDGSLKELQNTNRDMSNIYATARTAAEMRDAFDKGLVDPSLWGKGAAAVKSAFGEASPQMALFNKWEAFRARLASDELRLNTGTQTDKDYQAAKDSLTSTFGSMDPRTISTALHDYVNRTKDVAHKSHGEMVGSYKANYPQAHPGVFSPYEKSIADQGSFYGEYAKKSPAGPSGQNKPPLDSFKR